MRGFNTHRNTNYTELAIDNEIGTIETQTWARKCPWSVVIIIKLTEIERFTFTIIKYIKEIDRFIHFQCSKLADFFSSASFIPAPHVFLFGLTGGRTDVHLCGGMDAPVSEYRGYCCVSIGL